MQICGYELLLKEGVVIGMSYVEQTLTVQVGLRVEEMQKKNENLKVMEKSF